MAHASCQTAAAHSTGSSLTSVVPDNVSTIKLSNRFTAFSAEEDTTDEDVAGSGERGPDSSARANRWPKLSKAGKRKAKSKMPRYRGCCLPAPRDLDESHNISIVSHVSDDEWLSAALGAGRSDDSVSHIVGSRDLVATSASPYRVGQLARCAARQEQTVFS